MTVASVDVKNDVLGWHERSGLGPNLSTVFKCFDVTRPNPPILRVRGGKCVKDTQFDDIVVWWNSSLGGESARAETLVHRSREEIVTPR